MTYNSSQLCQVQPITIVLIWGGVSRQDQGVASQLVSEHFKFLFLLESLTKSLNQIKQQVYQKKTENLILNTAIDHLAIEDINNDNTELDSSFQKENFGLEVDVVAENDENQDDRNQDENLRSLDFEWCYLRYFDLEVKKLAVMDDTNQIVVIQDHNSRSLDFDFLWEKKKQFSFMHELTTRWHTLARITTYLVF